MKILFHGTSATAGERIKKYGFGGDNSKVWTCSNLEHVYFYDVDKMDGDDVQSKKEDGFRQAVDSARITSALNHINKDYLYIFEIHVDDDIYDSYFMDDLSAQNMENVAVCIDRKTLNILLLQDKITIYIHKVPYLWNMGLIYLSSISSNDLLNKNNLSYIENWFLNQIEYIDLYVDELYDIDFDSIESKKIQIFN